MRSTCGPADVLVHQRSAEIVHARIQQLPHTGPADLHPRGLNVVDVTVVGDPADCVDEHRLAEGGAASSLALQIDRRCHVDKRQRDELGEATGTLLEITRADEVPRPVHRILDGPEHDRHVRGEPHRVRNLVTVQPLLGVDLVGTQHGAHLVIEDLGSRTRKAPEPGIAQATEIHIERLAEATCPLGDLERSETVHVNVGSGFLHCPTHVDVVVTVEVGMDAALQRDLCGTQVPRLAYALGNVLEREQVGLAPEVERHRTLREAAELALERADIRVVDVPVVHPGNGVPHHLGTQLICVLRNGCHFVAPGAEQGGEFVHTGFLAHAHAVKHFRHRATHRRRCHYE